MKEINPVIKTKKSEIKKNNIKLDLVVLNIIKFYNLN